MKTKPIPKKEAEHVLEALDCISMGDLDSLDGWKKSARVIAEYVKKLREES